MCKVEYRLNHNLLIYDADWDVILAKKTARLPDIIINTELPYDRRMGPSQNQTGCPIFFPKYIPWTVLNSTITSLISRFLMLPNSSTATLIFIWNIFDTILALSCFWNKKYLVGCSVVSFGTCCSNAALQFVELNQVDKQIFVWNFSNLTCWCWVIIYCSVFTEWLIVPHRHLFFIPSWA